MREKTTLTKVSDTLYEYIIGDTDPDIPRDEFDFEASSLIESTNRLASHEVTSRRIASLLSTIFAETFEEDHSNFTFEEIAPHILKILHGR